MDGFDTARAGGHVFHFAPNPPLSKADFLQCLRDHGRRRSDDPACARARGPCVRILAIARRARSARRERQLAGRRFVS